MKYRVIEDLDAPEENRFQVESSCTGEVWLPHGGYAEQLSAEIKMEKLAKGPRIVAEIETA